MPGARWRKDASPSTFLTSRLFAYKTPSVSESGRGAHSRIDAQRDLLGWDFLRSSRAAEVGASPVSHRTSARATSSMRLRTKARDSARPPSQVQRFA
jgi:hypothetical protein